MSEPEIFRGTYIGRRLDGAKLVHYFEPTDGRGWRYWPKQKASWFAGARIGSIYEFGRIPAIWSAVKVGEVGEEERIALQTQDRAAEMQHRERKLSVSPDLDEYVRNLGLARLSLTPVQQVAFDAWLLNAVRRVK